VFNKEVFWSFLNFCIFTNDTCNVIRQSRYLHCAFDVTTFHSVAGVNNCIPLTFDMDLIQRYWSARNVIKLILNVVNPAQNTPHSLHISQHLTILLCNLCTKLIIYFPNPLSCWRLFEPCPPVFHYLSKKR
jgi:hypothetical protein